MYTGLIYGWYFKGDRIYGRMEEHTTRPDLNGCECHTSPVYVIKIENGDRIAKTQSGSTYKLVD